MKKIFCMILILTLSISVLTACSQFSSQLEPITKASSANEPTTKVSTTKAPDENEEDSYYTNNPIDVECEEVLEKNKNAEKSETIQNFSMTWKEEALSNYDKLYEILSPTHQKILKSAQADWENFAKAELKYQYARSEILDLEEEETAYNNALCYYEMYKERAFELRRYYDEIISKYGNDSYFEVESNEE